MFARTKPTVLAEKAKHAAAMINPYPFLLKKSRLLFDNTSLRDLTTLMGDHDHIGDHLARDIEPFSRAVR